MDKIKKSPIDLRVALKSIHQIIGNENYFNKPIIVGSVVTYMDILKITAREMKKEDGFFLDTIFLLECQNYGSDFSVVLTNFVSPLIESLRHDMTLSSKLVLKDLLDYPIKETIKRALDENIKIQLLQLD